MIRRFFLATLLALTLAGNAFAALNSQQRTLLKAYIDSVPALAVMPNNSESALLIAVELNKPATPAFIVWRTSVQVEEVMRNGMDWTRVDNLSVGKARIWDWMTRLGTLDPSKSNIRAGIDATWVGTAADLAVRAVVYTHCKRSATVVEKVLAAGAGTTADPATMTFEGDIGYADVQDARAQ